MIFFQAIKRVVLAYSSIILPYNETDIMCARDTILLSEDSGSATEISSIVSCTFAAATSAQYARMASSDWEVFECTRWPCLESCSFGGDQSSYLSNVNHGSMVLRHEWHLRWRGRKDWLVWRRSRLSVQVIHDCFSHEVKSPRADWPDDQDSLVSHHMKANWTR